jgi:hypothetical protein
MPRYSARRVAAMLNGCDTAPTADAAGDCLEELVAYVFEKLPGMELYERNILDAPRAHELDLAFWHIQAKSPVGFLDPIVIVECKNTGSPVGSRDVGWFVRKLQDRGANVGILVALSGITGAQAGNTNAHSEILSALVRDRIKILLLSRAELEGLGTTDDLVRLLREKYLALSLRLAVQ